MNKEQYIEDLNSEIKSGKVKATIDAEQIWDYAFLLTQYDKYGEVGYDELKELMIKEYFDDSEVSLYDWNEYCEENKYYDDYVDILDEDYFNTYYYNNPYKAVQDVINGDVNLADKYIKSTWSGLESFNDLSDMFDTEFYEWCLENERGINAELDEIKENAEIIIQVCNELIRYGY